MDNCLTYALRTYRYSRSSEHLDIRISKFGWFPHFAVIFEKKNGDLEKREYVPYHPAPKWFPPLFFKGYEKISHYKHVATITKDRQK